MTVLLLYGSISVSVSETTSKHPIRLSCTLDMEVGTQHIAKLEQYLLMSKAAKGAAAAKLIQDATSAPGVFVFAELLEQPNIQEVCRVCYLR